jgi:hypothetical protein
MDEHQSLAELRTLARRGGAGRGARIRRALLILAIPATAGLATACYGAPMYASGAQGDQATEATCSSTADQDGDGLVDEDDPDCLLSQKGCAE